MPSDVALLPSVYVVAGLVLLGIFAGVFAWLVCDYRATSAVEPFAVCRSSVNPAGVPPGTYTAPDRPPPTTSTPCGPAPVAPPTTYTADVQRLKSVSRACAQTTSNLSQVTQADPLPAGARVYARLSPAFQSAVEEANARATGDPPTVIRTDTYYEATVVQHVNEHDLLYDNDTRTATRHWQDMAGSVYTYQDGFDTTKLYGALTDNATADATNAASRTLGTRAFTLPTRLDAYPGRNHRVTHSPALTTYKSTSSGYVVQFANVSVQHVYSALGNTHPQWRVLTDVVAMPLPTTVDRCAQSCITRSGGTATNVQVGACANGVCNCICVPLVTESTDACAEPLVDAPPPDAYNVYTIDPSAAANLALQQRLDSATGTGGTATNTELQCAPPSGSSVTTQSCNCVSACERMNGDGSAGESAVQHCLSPGTLQKLLASVPPNVVLGTTPPLTPCPSDPSVEKPCPETPRPCRFRFSDAECTADSQCEWTNDPYKYRRMLDNSTCSTESSLTETSDVYKCIPKTTTAHVSPHDLPMVVKPSPSPSPALRPFFTSSPAAS